MGDSVLYSNTIGTTILRMGNGRHITLEDTLLVPKLGATLVSAKKLARNGCYALFNQERIVFVDSESKRPLVEAEARNRLYIVSKISKEVDSRCFKTVTNRPNIRKASSNQDGGDIEAFSTQING